jgi:nucleotide-binding universal stress UspA family protein
MDRSAPLRKPVASIVRIFHPSDFSKASHVAFAHALKLALEAKAELGIMHVRQGVKRQALERHWTDFPGVRATLARWGILPEGVRREDVGKTGLRVTKILASSADPVKSITRHLENYPPDLIVLATHQREGLARWMRRPVAEKIARRSGAMTLFVPRDGKGFIAPEDGAVTLKKILIPVDRTPDPQAALDKAAGLARGLGCRDAEFLLLHVGDEDELPPLDTSYYSGWRWERIARRGEVVATILEIHAEWKPDLMVLVTEGHLDFLDALRGSTTERVLRGARCPVLAIPAGIER